MEGDIMQGHREQLVPLRSPSPPLSLMAGAYQTRQQDHSFGSEPGQPREDSVVHPHFQHHVVVPGIVHCQIDILPERVSFPCVKPTLTRLPPS